MFVSAKKISDSVLQQYTSPKNTENCLRSIMLRGLESSSVLCESDVCCSVCCSGKVPYPKLDVLKPRVRKYQKRPIAIRELSESLMKQLDIALKQEREAVMVEKPCYQMLGVQYICCDAVIEELCSRAHYVTCVDDLNSVTLLRAELRSRFCNVILKVVSNAPPAKKCRKR